MSIMKLEVPQNGTSHVWSASENITQIEIENISDALFTRNEQDLVLEYSNGNTVTIENFYEIYSSEFIPDFIIDGNIILGEDFLASFSSDLLPAAGNSLGTMGELSTLNNSSLDVLEQEINETLDAGEGISGTISEKGVFTVAGLNSDLDFLQAEFILPNLPNELIKPNPDEPLPVQPKVFYATYVKESKTDTYTKKANEVSEPDNAVLDGSQYINDLKFDGENITITGSLSDLANSLLPDEVITILVGNHFITITGTNKNSDNMYMESFIANAYPVIIQNTETGNVLVYQDKDAIKLGHGNDNLEINGSMNGNNIVKGGNGADYIEVGTISGNATIEGNSGADEIVVDGYMHGNSQILGGKGKDTITLEKRLYNGTVDGGKGNDNITVFEATGVNGNAYINGGDGKDNITIINSLSGGTVIIDGGNGNDNINVNWMGKTSQNVKVLGGDGNDTFNIGRMENGNIQGGNGEDVINITHMNGGYVQGSGPSSEIDKTFITNMTGGTVSTEYVKVENMSGGHIELWENGNEVDVTNMTGGIITTDTPKMNEKYAGDDVVSVKTFYGGEINLGAENDTLEVENIVLYDYYLKNIKADGGTGSDTLKLTGDKDYNISLSSDEIVINGKEVAFKNFENITTGSGNDIIIGDNLDNTISSGSGNDILNGGLGNDILTGGYGADVFVFDSEIMDNTVDVITDFGAGKDVIDLTSYKNSDFSISFNELSSTITINDVTNNESADIILEGLTASDLASIQEQIDAADFNGIIHSK